MIFRSTTISKTIMEITTDLLIQKRNHNFLKTDQISLQTITNLETEAKNNSIPKMLFLTKAIS